MKKVMVVLAALVVAVWAAGAWSQGGPGQGGRGGRGGPGGPGGMMASCPAMAITPLHGPMIDRLAQDLGLTEDQVTQLKEVTAKGDAAMLPLAKKAGDATKALRDAVFAADYNEQTVKDLALAAEKAEAAIVNANIDQWTQIRAILTADQVTALQQMMNARGPGRGMGPGGPGGPGGPPPDDGNGPPPPPE